MKCPPSMSLVGFRMGTMLANVHCGIIIIIIIYIYLKSNIQCISKYEFSGLYTIWDV